MRKYSVLLVVLLIVALALGVSSAYATDEDSTVPYYSTINDVPDPWLVDEVAAEQWLQEWEADLAADPVEEPSEEVTETEEVSEVESTIYIYYPDDDQTYLDEWRALYLEEKATGANVEWLSAEEYSARFPDDELIIEATPEDYIETTETIEPE